MEHYSTTTSTVPPYDADQLDRLARALVFTYPAAVACAEEYAQDADGFDYYSSMMCGVASASSRC